MATDSSSVTQEDTADESTPLCHPDDTRDQPILTQNPFKLMRRELTQQDTGTRDPPTTTTITVRSPGHTGWKLNSSGYVELSSLKGPPLQHPPAVGEAQLGGRQDPDGHSVSSESVDLPSSVHTEEGSSHSGEQLLAL